MLRNLFLSGVALSLIAIAVLAITLPETPALAHSSIQIETPTPDTTQLVKNANDAVSHAQDILNVVNIFAAILAVVLTFLTLVVALLAIFGYKSYGEVHAVADDLREKMKEVQAEADNTRSAFENELRKNMKDVKEEADNTRQALIYLSVGDRLLDQRNTEEALENYRKAGSILPKDSQMNYVLGRIYSRIGDYDAAIATFEASHPEETVNQGKVLKELGLAYRRRGEALKQEADYDKAMECLRKAITLNPNDADTFAILGGLHRRKGEYQQALASYERAWRLNPSWSYPLGNLGSLSWYLGKPNEAKMYFGYTEVAAGGRIKMRQPEAFWDCYDLALAQLVSGNIAEAKQTYTEAIKATPSQVQLDAVLNNLYLLQKAPQHLPGLDEIVKMLEDAKVA